MRLILHCAFYLFMTGFFLIIMSGTQAYAFCGFYVAKADADLFNNASKVIIANSDDRNVVTMANDFQGEVKDFAIVIPVPTVITRNQVNITNNALIDHLDAYTAPRLVQYFDDNPCEKRYLRAEMSMMRGAVNDMQKLTVMEDKAAALGVTIEDQYTVGEYDILILSAEQSDGLFLFLDGQGYKLPKGAETILGSYIKQDMKFFVAKVNLEKFDQEGYTYLRPIQVAYDSPKFMLPIRLGTLNARGAQDLIIMTLTQKGRVEPVNYRTVKIPSDVNIPVYIENDFDNFYRDMFARSVEKENMQAVFLEYAWNMGWCDPCAADPIPNDKLRTLGAWWVDQDTGAGRPARKPVGTGRNVQPQPARSGGFPPPPGATRIAAPVDVYVTRMHVRYTATTFPEDIVFQETADTSNFQGRYVLQKPWMGDEQCSAATIYRRSLPERFEEEAKTLANLTGWDIGKIRSDMEENGQSFMVPELPGKDGDGPVIPWWKDIWKK